MTMKEKKFCWWHQRKKEICEGKVAWCKEKGAVVLASLH